MRVSDIQIIDIDDACQLQAQVTSDRDLDDGNTFPRSPSGIAFPPGAGPTSPLTTAIRSWLPCLSRP